MSRRLLALFARTLVVAWIWLLGGALAHAAPTVRTFDDDPLAVTEIVLDNGFSVLVSENHERAEVFGAVVVRAGSKNDPADHTGIAHYLEHMLFKGTQQLGTTNWAAEREHLRRIEQLYEQLAKTEDEASRRALFAEIDRASQRAATLAIPNELDRMLAELGASDVNAFTSTDATVYHNVLPASEVQAWLELTAHRFERPVFRLFASELEAVYEEKNASMDGYADAAYEAFLYAFFPDHPYGTQTTLGSVAHLRRPSLSAMRAFYETYYVASNMALVLSGDVDPEHVRTVAERTFGRWPARRAPTAKRGSVRPFRGRARETVRITPLRAGALAFRLPTRGHPDTPALRVLAQMLSNEQQSGVLDRLADRGKLLFAQAIRLDLHEHDGLVVIFVPRVVTQTFVGAERHVRRAIEAIGHGRIDAGLARSLRANLLREAQLSWEHNDERALAMADTWARAGTWQPYLDELAGLRRVEPADIPRVARRYLGADHLSMRSRIGFPKKKRLEKPGFTPVTPEPGTRSAYYDKTRPLPDPKTAPRFVDFDDALEQRKLSSYVTLAANDNPFNDIFTLELRWGVGRHHIVALQVLQDYLPRAGSRAHPAGAMKAALHRLATTLDVEVTDEATVLRLRGPQARLEPAVKLLAELVGQPALDGKRRRRIRREAWATERIARGDPAQVGGALWEYGLYGEGSSSRRYGRRNLWGLTARDVLQAWQQAQRYAVEIRYVGSRSVDEVGRIVTGAVPLRPDRRAVPKIVLARKHYAEDTVLFVKRRDAVQTQLYLFVEGDPIFEHEIPALHAFDAYLGGDMGGLLFQEIREYRALAYAATGGHAEPQRARHRGYAWAYAACQADKTPETLRVLTDVFADLPRHPQRTASIRSSLLRAQETADPTFRGLQEQIDAWRWQGYDTDPRRARIDAYRRIELDDVEAFWRKHVAGRPRVLMVVGDPRRVDERMLARFGEVHVIPERLLYAPP